MSTFQLPDETRVSQVHLRTADLERAIDFYQGVLGLSNWLELHCPIPGASP